MSGAQVFWLILPCVIFLLVGVWIGRITAEDARSKRERRQAAEIADRIRPRESSDRIDGMEYRDAYPTILDAMNAIAAMRGKES